MSQAPATTAMGVLSDVYRTYGSAETAVHALQGVDLEIVPGELVVLLGPSGSGKTTLLNVLGGIERPTSGRVVVAGRDLTAASTP
jgi:putative ABC transport system ATP-binding protein